jgi:hypothetical protein
MRAIATSSRGASYPTPARLTRSPTLPNVPKPPRVTLQNVTKPPRPHRDGDISMESMLMSPRRRAHWGLWRVLQVLWRGNRRVAAWKTGERAVVRKQASRGAEPGERAVARKQASRGAEPGERAVARKHASRGAEPGERAVARKQASRGAETRREGCGAEAGEPRRRTRRAATWKTGAGDLRHGAKVPKPAPLQPFSGHKHLPGAYVPEVGDHRGLSGLFARGRPIVSARKRHAAPVSAMQRPQAPCSARKRRSTRKRHAAPASAMQRP